MPKNLREVRKKVTLEVLEKMHTLVLAGFGLVAALAWNDAIKGIFGVYFPKPEENVWAQLLYAIGVTVAIVIVTILLGRSYRKAKEAIE